MFLTDRYANDFRELFAEAKNYVELQKKYAAVETAEKLTTVLSAMAIAVVCILLLSIVLLFSSFALAYWIGTVAGSLTIGFLSVTAINAILLIAFYANRRRWVLMPITRLISTVFACSMDTKAEEANLQEEIHASRARMSATLHEVVSPMPKTKSKAQGIGRLISNGMAIYEGMRIGMSIISAFRTLFGKRRR